MFQIFQQGVEALQDIAKALHDADRTNIVLAIATIVLALATLIFGILDRRRTFEHIRTSETRADNEHFERVRPWVVIDGPVPRQLIYQNGDTVDWEDQQKVVSQVPVAKVLIQYTYTNKGIKVAKDLKQIQFPKDEPFTKEAVQNEKERDVKMDLGPNQSQNTNVEVPWVRWQKLENQPLYLGYQISYHNGRDRSMSGSIHKIFSRGSQVLETWYT